MNSRIKEIRRHPKVHLSQEAFGKRLGITGSSVSLLESGRNQPSDQTIMLICREYGVNEDWLRTGKGEMFIETAQDTLGNIVRSYGLDEEDRIILEEFVELPVAERKSAIRYLRRIAARLDEMETQKRIPAAAPKTREEQVEAEAEAIKRRIIESNLTKGETQPESGLPPDGTGVA